MKTSQFLQSVKRALEIAMTREVIHSKGLCYFVHSTRNEFARFVYQHPNYSTDGFSIYDTAEEALSILESLKPTIYQSDRMIEPVGYWWDFSYKSMQARLKCLDEAIEIALKMEEQE